MSKIPKVDESILHSPQIPSASIAGRTLAGSRRRPWKVARETTTLDHLSRGWLVFGA